MLFSFFHPNVEVKKSRSPLPGQKVKVFHLEKAQAPDLADLLEHYLDGIKSQGSVLSDPSANTLIVTDDPENLQRVEVLVKAMDQTYDNPNPKARQMLASQQMLKAIRSLGPLAPVARPSERTAVTQTTASVASTPASTPVGVPAPLASGVSEEAIVSRDEETGPVLRRIQEDRPALMGFHLIGWVSDRKGLIVVLRNNGQRFIYRGGRILYGSLGSQDAVPGLSGIVQGEQLILRDGTQGFISLSMKPRADINGDIR